MRRGDVYKIRLSLPNRSSASGTRDLDKYVVVLQGGPNFESVAEVAVLIASSLRRQGPPRPFEVHVGPTDGFDHGTVIDARWPYTLPKSQVVGGSYQFTLTESRMYQVSVALGARAADATSACVYGGRVRTG